MEILFLAHRVPYPPTKGDKIRAWHFLAHLSRRHAVHLGCFVDDPEDWQHVDRLRAMCGECRFGALARPRVRWRALAGLIRGEAITVARLRDDGFARWTRDLLARRPVERIFVFSAAMARFLDAAPARPPAVIDFVDVDSEKWRRMANRSPWPLAMLYRREAERLHTFDCGAARLGDRCLLVSAAEARLFGELHPEAAGRTEIVANGVDGEHFSPEHRHADPFGPGGPVVVLTGDMAYWPNEDGARWFARDILPQVRTGRPGVRFFVVGRRPGRRLRRIAASAGATVTGAVPDVRPYLAHAALAVAPLRVTQGVPNKVLEAMAMARPVVATSAAVEGLRVQAGRDLLVGASAQEFASAILGVLAAPDDAAALGARARAKVLADYRWAPSLERLETLLTAPPGP